MQALFLLCCSYCCPSLSFLLVWFLVSRSLLYLLLYDLGSSREDAVVAQVTIELPRRRPPPSKEETSHGHHHQLTNPSSGGGGYYYHHHSNGQAASSASFLLPPMLNKWAGGKGGGEGPPVLWWYYASLLSLLLLTSIIILALLLLLQGRKKTSSSSSSTTPKALYDCLVVDKRGVVSQTCVLSLPSNHHRKQPALVAQARRLLKTTPSVRGLLMTPRGEGEESGGHHHDGV